MQNKLHKMIGGNSKMKKTFKGALALTFCVVTVFATMLIASAISAPKAKVKSVTYNSVTIT